VTDKEYYLTGNTPAAQIINGDWRPSRTVSCIDPARKEYVAESDIFKKKSMVLAFCQVNFPNVVWQTEATLYRPQAKQTDDFNCGIFACVNASCISLGRELPQLNITDFQTVRNWLAYIMYEQGQKRQARALSKNKRQKQDEDAAASGKGGGGGNQSKPDAKHTATDGVKHTALSDRSGGGPRSEVLSFGQKSDRSGGHEREFYFGARNLKSDKHKTDELKNAPSSGRRQRGFSFGPSSSGGDGREFSFGTLLPVQLLTLVVCNPDDLCEDFGVVEELRRVHMPYATTLADALLKVSPNSKPGLGAPRQLPRMHWLKKSLDKRGQAPSSKWVLVNDEVWQQLLTVSNSANYTGQVLHVEYVKLAPVGAISSSASGGDKAPSAREAADSSAAGGDEAYSHASRDLALAEGRIANDDPKKHSEHEVLPAGWHNCTGCGAPMNAVWRTCPNCHTNNPPFSFGGSSHNNNTDAQKKVPSSHRSSDRLGEGRRGASSKSDKHTPQTTDDAGGRERDASSHRSQSPRRAAKAQSWDAVGAILRSTAGGDEARSGDKHHPRARQSPPRVDASQSPPRRSPSQSDSSSRRRNDHDFIRERHQPQERGRGDERLHECNHS
jgi:hypothetical protein